VDCSKENDAATWGSFLATLIIRIQLRKLPFRRFMNDTFTEATDRKSTMGLDHYGRTFHVGDRDLKLQLWDTGGIILIITKN
jgi:hypothetical protein